MIRTDLNEEYFMWLSDIACRDMFPEHISYMKLLRYLHEKTFRFLIPNDKNRAEDGCDLRYRYARNNLPDDIADDIYNLIDGPCSVLEMMVALAIHCEEFITDNPDYGDRTKQWFWNMITTLGLGAMSDDRFDKFLVDNIIERFLERDYEPDGQGGLFHIQRCEHDLRHVEIWHQLCWYIDSITCFDDY